MKPWLKILLISLGIIIIIPIVASIILTQLYSNKLKQILVEELNEQLLTKVEINGEASIAFWESFPMVSLEIKNVVIYGSKPFIKKKVLVCDRAYLAMDIMDVINQRWNIKSILLEKANLYLFKNKNGKINYQFVKNNKSSKEQEIQFNINKATLKKVLLIYEDETNELVINNIIDNAIFKGKFSKDELALDLSIKSLVKNISYQQQNYLPEKTFDLTGSIKIDNTKNQYQVVSKSLNIQDNEFSFNGLFSPQKNGTNISININTEDGNISNIIKLMPQNLTNSIKDLNLEGFINSNININGLVNANTNPFINAKATLKNGSFKVSAINSNAENISAVISYNNGSYKNNQSSVFKVDMITGVVAKNNIKGQLEIKNFDDPNLYVQYSGNLDLGVLQPLIINESIQGLTGLLQIENLDLRTNINKLKKLESEQDLQIETTLKIENLQLKIKDEIFSIAKGNLQLNQKDINLQNAVLNGLQSNINLNLNCENWKAYLFAITKPESALINQLIINADVNADNFNWTQWQNFFKVESSPSKVKSNTFINRNQLANLGGKAKVKIKSFNYDKFNANAITTELTFTPNQIFLHNLNFAALKGEADAKGYFAFKERILEVNFSLVARNTNIKKLFSSFNNFNQNAIKEENLEGTLTSDIKFSAIWNKGIFDPNSLYTYADIKIDNGALLNFKPLESLSRFVKLDELKNIRFGTLKNTIEIKNQTITIPKMLISSSVLNIGVMGTQSFLGNINYQVKLNLFDVLGKKFGRNKQSFEFEEPDENSFNLFLTITGTTDKPIVNYDRTGIKDKFKKQKEAFKDFKEGKQEPYTKNKESKDWELKEELEEIKWD